MPFLARCAIPLFAAVLVAPPCSGADSLVAAELPGLEAARRILTPPFDDRARELLDMIPDAGSRKEELVPLLKELVARPIPWEDDAEDVAWALLFASDDARIAEWLDSEGGDHEIAMRLIPLMSGSAGDWLCQGLSGDHDGLHAVLLRQLERREGARREAVMDLLIQLDCQLGAAAEPLLRMLADEREDRRAFARRSLLRCKGGMAWLRGSLAGADDVLAASLGDPVRRAIVLELLASGSCRESVTLTAALEAELAHAPDAERPVLEAALRRVRPMRLR